MLDLTRLFPGAYCTSLLADLGADVLKVEAPGYGDGLRFMGESFPAAHVALNRGKRSMTLNLKSPSARQILHRLARDADVLVESGRPGALDKLGAGFDDLRADNAGLIWCSITGFGPDGPNANAPGHDLTYLGYSGLLAQLVVDDVPPIPSTPITLQMAGAHAAFGIVAAVHGRERTGVGVRVDANMVDSGIWMLAEQLTRAANSSFPGWGSSAARNNYRCADGRWITCTGSEPKAWALIVDALGLPDLADHKNGDDERRRHRDARGRVRHQAAARIGSSTRAWPAVSARCTSWTTCVDDPQITHREGMPQPGGDGPRVVANPLRFDRATGDAGSHAFRSAARARVSTPTPR